MAEAAGFVLAAVPLIVATAEKYNRVYGLIKTYRRYDDEVYEVSVLLGNQKAAFRGQFRLLLRTCVPYEDAVEMSRDSEHPLWQDQRTIDALKEHLDDSYPAICDTVQLLQTKLDEVHERCQAFEEVIQNCNQISYKDSKQRKAHVSKKLKFVLREGGLLNSIEAVRKLTQDFTALRATVNEARQGRKEIILRKPKIVNKQFLRVQEAAKDLYCALGSACTVHDAHQARFCLEPHVDGAASHVRFNLTFRQSALVVSNASENVTWLTIESRFEGSIATNDDPAAPTHPNPFVHRKRKDADVPPKSERTGLQKIKKMVRFNGSNEANAPPANSSTTTSYTTAHTPSSTAPPQIPSPTLPNFCSHTSGNNFCNRLRRLYNGSQGLSNECVGYLQHEDGPKYLVYLESVAQALRVRQPAVPLADYFTGYSGIPGRVNPTSLTPLQAVTIAKQLAIAVLQFQSTPWLRDSWSSNDIHVSLDDHTQLGASSALSKPFIDVPVKSPHSPPSRTSTLTCQPFAPNQILFGLGVMMLEIANRATLQSLREPVDESYGTDKKHLDFFTAKRVSKIASSSLGTRYGEATRKCLQCNFGHGDDLSNPLLQDSVYSQVVCELEEVEQGLRKIGL